MTNYVCPHSVEMHNNIEVLFEYGPKIAKTSKCHKSYVNPIHGFHVSQWLDTDSHSMGVPKFMQNTMDIQGQSEIMIKLNKFIQNYQLHLPIWEK